MIKIEQSVIDYLADLGITAAGQVDAPGIYVDTMKVGSIGLRVRRGHSYHGLALNIAMDLTPFSYINPCGFQGLPMVTLADKAPRITLANVKIEIIPYFLSNFGYNQPHLTTDREPLESTLHD